MPKIRIEFDSEYLENEVLKFREMMGKKSFWEDLDQVSGAIFGLLWVWYRTKNVSLSLKNIMIATCKEYDKRLMYALLLPRR